MPYRKLRLVIDVLLPIAAPNVLTALLRGSSPASVFLPFLSLLPSLFQADAGEEEEEEAEQKKAASVDRIGG